MTEPVAWDLAERVAIRVAKREPLEDSYLYARLEPDFEELTAQAEELVEAETGLRSLAGPARARVTDRQGWVAANIASFQRLLRPVTDRLGAALDAESTAGPSGLDAPLPRSAATWPAPRSACCSAGCRPGCSASTTSCSSRTSTPRIRTSSTTSGPNILALEKRFAFPPREFRLWLALHEVTHRVQFTGVPWMRAHFLSLVETTLAGVDPDPAGFLDALRRAADRSAQGQQPARRRRPARSCWPARAVRGASSRSAGS